MSLCDVKHQGRAQDMLQQAFLRDRVPHAYIFHGPDGVGKETFARGFAQLVLCGTPTDHALKGDDAQRVGVNDVRTGCGRCEDCRLVMADTHPDHHLVYRQLSRQHPDSEVRKRKGLDIGVDVIRHFLVSRVQLSPSRARAKVFVVREADRITPQAQNALLKTLEEPPGTTYLILLTASVDRLLPTTLSRCQMIEFNALPTGFVREKLSRLYPQQTPDQLDWYARSAGGSLGHAVEAIHDERLALSDAVIDSLIKLDDHNAGRVIKEWTTSAEAIAGAFAERDPDITDTEAIRTGFKTIFRLAAHWYADALRVRTGQEDNLVNASRGASLANIATNLDQDGLIDRINRLAAAEGQLDLNANVKLCIENVVRDLAGGVCSQQ